jgi:hypothetical protein
LASRIIVGSLVWGNKNGTFQAAAHVPGDVSISA